MVDSKKEDTKIESFNLELEIKNLFSSKGEIIHNMENLQNMLVAVNTQLNNLLKQRNITK
jgi:Tfp pilus assembly protein PilO